MSESFNIHDHSIEDLIQNLSFSQAIYYLWTGRMPSDDQAKLLEVCLVAVLDHGPEALSTKTARMASSGGAELHAAIAAGCLSASKYHGTLPIKESAELFQSAIERGQSAEEFVGQFLDEKKRIPGFGHRVYEIDPRTQAILRKIDQLGLTNETIKFALEVEVELEKQKGKKLCLNIDGMIGALLPALEISAELGQSIFLIGRLPSMSYHALQEQKEKPQRMREV